MTSSSTHLSSLSFLVTSQESRHPGLKELTGGSYLSFITLETLSFQNVECNFGYTQRSGGYREDVTPVPIPNTEVKLIFGDDTWAFKPWESSTLPVYGKRHRKMSFFYIYFTFSLPPPLESGWRLVQENSDSFVSVRNSTYVEISSIRR